MHVSERQAFCHGSGLVSFAATVRLNELTAYLHELRIPCMTCMATETQS